MFFKKRILKNIISLSKKIGALECVKIKDVANAIKIIDAQKIINLETYKGMFALYLFIYSNDKKIVGRWPTNFFEDRRFVFCKELFLAKEIKEGVLGNFFYKILTMPDTDDHFRDIIMGSFYLLLWKVFNTGLDLNKTVTIGIDLIQHGFKLDNFDIRKKIKLKNKYVINLAGSGKKTAGFSLVNLSSMAALVVAASNKITGKNLAISKTTSEATSSMTGSGDIFSLVGVNVDASEDLMLKIMEKINIGIFNIDKIVPKLNSVYDKRLYNTQVFAGLLGGAAIVNPVHADLINYGLTDGEQKITFEVLKKLYPESDVIIFTGFDKKGLPVMDQISVLGKTLITKRIKKYENKYSIGIEDFGFLKISFNSLLSKNNPAGNLDVFLGLVFGCGNMDVQKTVAMEASLNLLSSGVVESLSDGVDVALETIKAGHVADVLKDLIIETGGDLSVFKNYFYNIKK